MKNPKEIRIKIAEFCGTMKWSFAAPTKTIHCDVPKYEESLEDMRDAEMKLSGEQLHDYYDLLEERLCWEYPSASAAVRAQAFVDIIPKG